jgi:hypothetical protein
MQEWVYPELDGILLFILSNGLIKATQKKKK